MKPAALAGIVLIVLGVVALLYQGITYTKRETVLDIGPLHATADREKTLPLPPVLGIAAIAGGVALLVVGHDVSNQLSIVLGFSALLIGGMSDDDPRKADLLEIEKAAQAALRLITQSLLQAL
jgi:UDP-N-acetylmuramyl pentapeptide phosphotransferase/UDP-N-acetylglucosamine-1-phosphate transferase